MFGLAAKPARRCAPVSYTLGRMTTVPVPADLRKTFVAFRDECVWLQTCYNTFNTLFPHDKSTDSVLRHAAPQFFAELNTVYVEYWTLIVSRLTDPPRTMGRENLTVRNLTESLGSAGLLTAEIQRLADGLQSYRALINDARNKLVSHADKAAFLSDAVIGAHGKTDVQRFVGELQVFNDRVGEVLGEGPLDYQCTGCAGDAQDLLRALRDAA